MKELTFTSTWVSVVLLLICLVSVNLTAFFIPLRFDLTEENLYTISNGSIEILENLKDPVRINFYYSRNNAELPPNFKNYAQRVEELLEEFSGIPILGICTYIEDVYSEGIKESLPNIQQAFKNKFF